MLSERAQEGGERVGNKIIKVFLKIYLAEETKESGYYSGICIFSSVLTGFLKSQHSLPMKYVKSFFLPDLFDFY